MRHFLTPLLVLIPLASAQLQYDSRTQSYRCGIPDAAYCAGTSNTTNIIVRCKGRVGHRANCNDNLAGYSPVGVSYSPCIQSSDMEGDAACSKDGEIYRDTGAPSGGANPPGHTYVSFSTQAIPPDNEPTVMPSTKPHTHDSDHESMSVSASSTSTSSITTSATSASVSYLAPNTTTPQTPVYTGGATPLECFSWNGAVFAIFFIASFGGLIAGAAS